MKHNFEIGDVVVNPLRNTQLTVAAIDEEGAMLIGHDNRVIPMAEAQKTGRNVRASKRRIAALVEQMLNESHKNALKKVQEAVESGAIRFEGYDETYDEMRLPRAIVTAILETEASQCSGFGDDYQRKVRREANNIKNFL